MQESESSKQKPEPQQRNPQRQKSMERSAGIAAIVFATILGITSMYFAAAGWVIANLDTEIVSKSDQGGNQGGEVVYDGVSFANIYEARAAIEKDKVTALFKWTYNIPASLPLFITAISFGILGGLANVTYKAIGGEIQTNRRLVLKPIFSGLIGLMVLGLSYVLPAILTVSEDKVRPVSLAFLCLYAGAFSNHVYLWLEEKIKSLFALDKKGAAQAPKAPNTQPDPAI